MSLVENLLLNINPTDEIKSKHTTKGNFLLDLLNSYKNDIDKLTDLFKSLNIDEKDLDKFFDNNKNELTADLKDLINKIKISLKTKSKEPINQLKSEEKNSNKPIIQINNEKHNTVSDILKFLIGSKPVSNSELEKKISEITEEIKSNNSNKEFSLQIVQSEMKNNNIRHLEEKIVKITKDIILSGKTLEKLKLTDKEINRFKEIKSFKELINFANKKELNISKIIISYKKQLQQHIQKKTVLPKNKIEIKPDKKNVLSFSKQQKTEKSIQKELLNTLLKKDHKKEIDNSLNQTAINHRNQKDETEKPKIFQKTSSNIQNSSNTNIIQELKQNIHKAKESVKHFANTLKETIENYKPPISKLSLELHPKELGKVDVTIVHRGDNLQIQINSNNTAISFMHSQQQELRQNLINMGFTDVNMSFNQNQQQGNKEYRQNQKFANTSNEENDELIIEIPYQYA